MTDVQDDAEDGGRTNVKVRRRRTEDAEQNLAVEKSQSQHSDDYNAMRTLYEARSPDPLYAMAQYHSFFPQLVRSSPGHMMVVRENGTFTKATSSGDCHVRSLVDTEIFFVHMGNVEHALKFSLGSRPQNMGSHANLSFSYKVSNAVASLREGALNPEYLRPIIFRNTNESVNEWQDKSGNKPLGELTETDHGEIVKRLRDKIGPLFSAGGLDLKETYFGVELSQNELALRDAKRQISSMGELLQLREALELKNAEMQAKRIEFEETAARNLKIAGSVAHAEAAIRIHSLIRENLKSLEDKSFDKDADILTRALAYERLALLTAAYLGNPGQTQESTQTGSSLVKKILESELEIRSNPANLKMIQALGEGLGKANIDLRVGNGGIEDLIKDGAGLLTKIYENAIKGKS